MTPPPSTQRRRAPGVVASLVGCLVTAAALPLGVPQAAAGSATAPEPVLSVQPASNLLDGQSVLVTGSGFAASAQVAVGECETGATSARRCSVAGALAVPTSASGGFSVEFTVSRSITIGPSTIDCSNPGACVIGAAVLPALTSYATASIAFAPPSTPAPPGPGTAQSRYYLALGDSLAVGFGAPSGQGYVDQLSAYYEAVVPGLQLENLGCSGETTTTFRSGGRCPYAAGSQLAQAEAFLSSHSGQVALVTIDIGGDDITGCASTTPPFAISAACVAHAVATAQTNLEAIGAGLRAAAGPSVPIVGMTYYDPFVVEWLSGPAGQAAAQSSVADLEQLNAALERAYASFGARVADAQDAFFSTDFGDLVPSPFGTIPKNVATACAWLLVVCATTSPVIVGVHPNATGYGVVAAAFEAALPASELAAAPPAPPPGAPSTPGPTSPVPPALAYSGFPTLVWLCVGLGSLVAGLALLGLSRRRQGGARARAAG